MAPHINRALFLAISSTLFITHYLLRLEDFLRTAGGALMMIGGAFILVGLYIEYKTWIVKRL